MNQYQVRHPFKLGCVTHLDVICPESGLDARLQVFADLGGKVGCELVTADRIYAAAEVIDMAETTSDVCATGWSSSDQGQHAYSL